MACACNRLRRRSVSRVVARLLSHDDPNTGCAGRVLLSRTPRIHTLPLPLGASTGVVRRYDLEKEAQERSGREALESPARQQSPPNHANISTIGKLAGSTTPDEARTGHPVGWPPAPVVPGS